MRIVYFVFFALLIPLASMAQASSTVTVWQDDMGILQQKIFQKYPQLLDRVSPQEFEQVVKALQAEIPKMNRYEIIMGIAKIVALYRVEKIPPAVQA